MNFRSVFLSPLSITASALRNSTVALLLMCFSFEASAMYGIAHGPNGLVIELSEPAKNAVDSGVSLTFVCEFSVINRRFFIDWLQSHEQHRFTLSKHALSNRYLVHRGDNLKPMIFRSSDQGVAYISKASNKLFNAYSQDKSGAKLRLSLNKFRLPAPLRLSAFISKQWDFDSGWSE